MTIGFYTFQLHYPISTITLTGKKVIGRATEHWKTIDRTYRLKEKIECATDSAYFNLSKFTGLKRFLHKELQTYL